MDATDRRRRVSQEAATWFIRLQTEELQRADREEFVDWLRESSAHVAEMLRMAKVHDRLEQLQSWLGVVIPETGDIEPGDHDNVVSLPSHPEDASSLMNQRAKGEAAADNTRRRFWLGAMAAGLAAVAVLGVLFAPSLRGSTIETERGERRAVALPDGSVVDVDPETRLRVVFEDRTRRVILGRGRALFRVAKSPVRPFLVEADGTTVRAVGTAFAVERQQQGIVVTVAEGKVGVSVNEAPTSGYQPSPPAGGGGSRASRAGATTAPEVFLTAGQQVKLSKVGEAEPVRIVDSGRELAWAKGNLVFDNETVAAAAAEFNRYNRIQLRVTDPALAARPVSGIFDASDPESFIGFLETVTSARVTRSDSEIIMR